MKVALINDTHHGARNDKEVFYDYKKRFFDECFFPALKEYGINTVIHLGDILERRRYVNFVTLKRLQDDFLIPLEQMGVGMTIIPGNHDTYYKNTNEVNSPTLLFRHWPLIQVVQRPSLVNLEGVQVALVPWICEENAKRTSDFLRRTKAKIVFGHFELSGFEMDKGRVMDHGSNRAFLSRFDLVASGHYHHKSSQGNIHYLGAPFQTSWTDYNDVRGFHIFDTETCQLEFIPNPYADMFVKYIYDDKDMTLEQMMDSVSSFGFAGKFVKIVVTNKTNPFIYDLIIDAIEKAGISELQVVEDHFNIDAVADEEIIRITEDTVESMGAYIDAISFGVDKDALKRRLRELHTEALTIQ